MKTLDAFNKLSSIDDYLAFFQIKANERLVNSKRLHILKLFGESIEKLKAQNIAEEERLLDIYRFALLTIVKRFEEGFSPNAAEIWNMLDRPSSCLVCASAVGCSSAPSDLDCDRDAKI
jgi:hypothetical protein